MSPFGVIPKSEVGKWRLILDLSSPEGFSVNDGIKSELCSLSYMSVDDVARRVRDLGKGTLMAKFDLNAAYRNVPVHPSNRWLLGMVREDNLYVDIVLPFGLRSAPAIFSAVTDALAFIVTDKGVRNLDHYLDDFIVLGSPCSDDCQKGLQVALEACDKLGFPVALEKMVGPSTKLTFLGIEVDSMGLQLSLPEEKLRKLTELVASWRRRKGCKKRELQSLAGYLNHACKVVRPGRRFLRGVFGLLSQFKKRDHMIRLNSAFRADLEWWHAFAREQNGMAMMRGGELWGAMERVELWSDASGSWSCGAIWDIEWLQIAWGEWPALEWQQLQRRNCCQ